METWKPIKGYEDDYEVSNYGRIRNFPHIVKMPRGGHYISAVTINIPTKNGKGYGRVFLSQRNKVTTKYVHRLVAENWCTNPLNYKEVNHIDGNKENNMAYNLEWVSRKENCVHARRMGLFIPAPSKLNESSVSEIVAMRKSGAGRQAVADKYGIATATVSGITSGRIWSWHTRIEKRRP